MPKRKRGADIDPVRLRKEEVEQKLVHCKKLLNKALKLAKGFERQKLGKRVKLAIEKADEDDLKRLNREIEVLKTLDFSRVVDAHLHKTLLKSKSIAESHLLPDHVRTIPKSGGGDEEHILALNNVTARMYNSKPVKDVMSQIMTVMYITLEIPEPPNCGKGKKVKVDTKSVDREAKNGETTSVKKANAEDNNDPDDAENQDLDHDMDISEESSTNGEEPWEGFGSEGEESDNDSDNNDDDDFSLDEEQLSRYDALLGNSSDESDISDSENHERESSFPPQTISTQQLSKPKRFLSISLSPSPPPSNPKSILKRPKVKPDLEPPKGSVFLPTLMGGYWSGTESEASDTESHTDPQPRKNRRGQRERRKIAELKFGARAKHLQAENDGRSKHSGNNSRRDDRDKDWDMKRGARLSTDGDTGPRNRKERRMGGVKVGRVGRDNRQMTGENAVPVGDRGANGDRVVNGTGKVKDNDGKKGINHPSWQAAKKAKEANQMATFQGTKVKFS